MEYSRDDSIKKIVDFKKQWDDANNAGDLVAKGNAEKYAKKVYDMMRANGDSDVADELSASDYTKAQQVQAKYNQITNNNSVAGEVQQPVSSSVVSKENADVTEKYKKIFQTATEENPYETEVGKSIMGKYNLAAIQGRENQLASGAATNGGNIDSFSAANAMRQQAALIYQGQDAALAAHQQKIDNAQKILEGMGVHINRIFEQDETAKNNEVSRLVAQSEVTGYVPNELAIKSDPVLSTYLNTDGTVKPEYEKVDFQQLINNAKAAGNNELAKKYAIIRTRKMLGNMAEYGKYLSEGDTAYMTPQETAAVKQANADRESAERIVQAESENELNKLKVQGNIDKELLKLQIASGILSDDGETYLGLGPDGLTDVLLDTADQSPALGLDGSGNNLLKALRNNWSTLPISFIDYSNVDDINFLLDALANLSTRGTPVNVGQMQHVLIFLGLGSLRASDYFENIGSDWTSGVRRTEKRYPANNNDDDNVL